jgi:hypothetical protein
MNCSKLGPMPTEAVPGPVMDRIGDIDPITHGGGIIFQTSHGPYLEYTEGADGISNTDSEEADELKDTSLTIFRTHIARDVIAQFGVDPEDVLDMCEAMEVSPRVWIRDARDPDPSQRARCITDIAQFIGWEEIDEDPLLLGEVELHLRWYGNFNEEGPITTPGCFRPEVIVPEMLRTLKTLHSESYWELFRHPFPIVPSEAVQDPEHAWWKQHGSEAVNKLVETLKRICPKGYSFELREETFGFWKER